MTTKTGRQYRTQQTHYLRKAFAYTVTSGTGYLVGTLPPNAVVLGVTVAIQTAFNAGTNNFIDVGTSGTAGALAAHGSITATAVGVTRVAPATLGGLLSATAETDVYVTYTQSGTAGTTGAAIVVVEFAVDNDG